MVYDDFICSRLIWVINLVVVLQIVSWCRHMRKSLQVLRGPNQVFKAISIHTKS